MSAAAIMIGPVILFKNQRALPSLDLYLRLIQYFLIMVLPFLSFLLWNNWREITKKRRGYGWIGKFEVINKRASFGFRYLILSPGSKNQIKVNRILFDKTGIGDTILIRRNAFGAIEEVSKVNNFSSRLAKVAAVQRDQPQVK